MVKPVSDQFRVSGTTLDHEQSPRSCWRAMESAATGTVQKVQSTFEPPPPMPASRRGPQHLIHDLVHEDA